MVRREEVSKEEWDAIQAAEARAGLTDDQRDVLQAIVAGDLAWTPLASLEARWYGKAVDELTAMKMVDHWSLNGEPQVTLSRYGAWLMQVHILERLSLNGEELEEDPYWAEVSKEPPTLKIPSHRREVQCSWLDQLPDPKADQPADAVMIDEVSGNPVLMFGKTIKIDRRLKGKGGAKQPKRRAG